MVDQELHDIEMAMHRRQMQGRPAVAVGRVDLGPTPQEIARNLGATVASGS